MHTIEVEDLSHRFTKGEKVLDGINLQVREGSIYGFLGPNGAGKTTSLRLLLGLLKKQSGNITLFGQGFETHRTELLRKIGSLIESPSLYGQLTATENLQVYQKIYQCPKARIPAVLKMVGLAHTGLKKAGQFSLGMKQRLGIAVALLHEPSLLILDEPTNGLDPSGIVEIRELLKNLNLHQGITIMISSHLLSEIEKLVTDVGIINKGKMMFEGSLEELMQRQRQSSYIAIETNKPAEAYSIIQQMQANAELMSNGIQLPAIEQAGIAAINRALVQGGIEVYGIVAIKNDLETIFMNLTNN